MNLKSFQQTLMKDTNRGRQTNFSGTMALLQDDSDFKFSNHVWISEYKTHKMLVNWVGHTHVKFDIVLLSSQMTT